VTGPNSYANLKLSGVFTDFNVLCEFMSVFATNRFMLVVSIVWKHISHLLLTVNRPNENKKTVLVVFYTKLMVFGHIFLEGETGLLEFRGQGKWMKRLRTPGLKSPAKNNVQYNTVLSSAVILIYWKIYLFMQQLLH